MSKELNKYYRRVTSYIISVEDFTESEWTYVKHCIIGGNSMAAVRTAYPLLTEKQCVNKNASLSQNKVIQEQLEIFKNKVESNREKALTDIYHRIEELKLDRVYMLRKINDIMNKAEEACDFGNALRASEIISKIQGHYSPIRTEQKTEVSINFGGWSPDAKTLKAKDENLYLDEGNITNIAFKEIDFLDSDLDQEEE